MIATFLLYLLIGLPAVLLLIWLKNAKFRNAINQYPGPKTMPLLGNALQIGTDAANNFRQHMKWAKEYKEGVFRVWFGPTAIICVYKAEYLDCVLSTSNHKKAEIYKFFNAWLRSGLLISFGSKWQKRRKMLTPTFHYSILEDFMSVFHQQSEKLVRILKEKKDNEEFDIFPYIGRIALEVMCLTAMGTDLDTAEGQREYVNAIHKIGNIIVGRIAAPWYFYDPIFNLTSKGKEHVEVIKVLHGFTLKIIKERWREYEEKLSRGEKLGQEEFDEFGKKKRLAFLDLLIQNSMADQSMTIQDIQEEVDTFMFEGHDTTSSAIGWAIYNLGRQPDWQEKIRNEILQASGRASGIKNPSHSQHTRNLLADLLGETRLPSFTGNNGNKVTVRVGSGEGKMTMKEVNELKLLDCFLKESIRLFTAVPFAFREITEECQIGSYHCPKGATVQILFSALHRDPRYFPDPEKFNPERWLGEDIAKRHAFCYAPFSSGLRNCIGQKFAQLEWKITVINIVKNFYITCDHDLDDLKHQDGIMILRPSHGIPIKLKAIH